MLEQFKAIDRLFDQINNVFHQADDLSKIMQTAADQIRAYLEIDRVKVYAFDPDGNGQVIAESLVPDRLPSLLGLHFPAADIPPPARQIFIEARQRVIVNVAAKRKALCPIPNPYDDRASLDHDIRYGPVDECHLHYLESMGVMASLTVPIIDNGKLWGLVAIHHSEPYNFSEQQLQMVQLWANLIAVALAKLTLMNQATWQDRYLDLMRYIHGLLSRPFPLDGEVWGSVLETAANTMQADGARLYLSNQLINQPGEVYSWGQQPRQPHLEETSSWVEAIQLLQAEPSLGLLPEGGPGAYKGYTHSPVRQGYDLAPVCCQVDSVSLGSSLASAFDGTPIQRLLIVPIWYQSKLLGSLTFFRCPQLVERSWAGQYSDDQRQHLPRKSFETWVETCQRVLPWQPEVVQMAQEVGVQLYSAVVQQGARKLVTQKSAYDAVTNLPVDKLLQHTLSLKLFHIKQNGAELSLGILGLDRFKSVNESLGHAAGDYLLAKVADRLRRYLNIGVSEVLAPVLGRWHGDNFVIALPYTGSYVEISQYSQKLLEVFDDPFTVNQQDVYITASIGWAMAPYSSESLEMLLQHAETAMHSAKRAGKNTFRIYDSTFHQHTTSDVAISTALHNALTNHELILYYQPQLDLKTSTVSGVEALIRWQHPQLGMVSPGRFIPIAEETGLIVPIGKWVLQQACHQHRVWIEQGLPPLKIAINLSLTQFQDPNLVEDTIQTVTAFGIDPRWIELEITEEATTQDLHRTVKQLRILTEYGFTIALDDFGKGYSSLNILKHFPLHALKIDRSFIQDIDTDGRSAAIAKTIIALGEGLNLNTIAEGVETQEQMETLRSIGCHQIQGYWLSRPMAPAAMGQWLRTPSKTMTLPYTQPPKASVWASQTTAGPMAPPRLFSASGRVASSAGHYAIPADSKPMASATKPSSPAKEPKYKRLKEDLKLESQRRQFVSSIALKIRESMDLEGIFNLSVTEVRHLLDTDRVVLFRFNENWIGQVVQESVTLPFQSIINETIEDPCFRGEYVNYYRQGRVRAIDDITQAGLAQCHIDMLSRFGVKANLVVPVLYQGNLWGLMIAHHCRSPRQWHTHELEMLNELAVHIGIAINQGELYRKLTQANQELRRLSGEDRLTRLANRHRFDTYLAKEWTRHLVAQTPLAAVFCDADNFKAYNDIYGHNQGDECLRQLAQVLQRAARRPSDLVARYGGEEFVLLLPETTLAGAKIVAERILQDVRALHLPHSGSPYGIVTVSLGVSSMVPSSSSNGEDLIRRADLALYKVKQNGRNNVSVHILDSAQEHPQST